MRAGGHDAGFFGGDLLDSIAQNVGVFVGERGDHRGVFFAEDVGAVEPPAEADFDDLDVDLVVPEGVEGERGEQLEGADVARLGGELGLDVDAQLVRQRGEVFLG